jgi:hypothetical protein
VNSCHGAFNAELHDLIAHMLKACACPSVIVSLMCTANLFGFFAILFHVVQEEDLVNSLNTR